MRKYLFLCMSIILFGCTEVTSKTDTIEPYAPILTLEEYKGVEAELSEKKNIEETLKIYIKYFSDSDSEKSINTCMFNPTNMLFTTINSEDRVCFFNAGIDDSDRCIVARREVKPTRSCYFNYKKYLPEDLKEITEDDFLQLINVYKRSSARKLQDCLNNKLKTSIERSECADRVDQYLALFAYQKIGNSKYKKLKKCSEVVAKEYKEKFINNQSDRINLFGWTKTEQDMYCSAKALAERKETFRKYAKAHVKCGQGYIYGDCIHCDDWKCYSYVVEGYTSDPFFKDETLKFMIKTQEERITDFGIQNNCYISWGQLEDDNYKLMLNEHMANCKAPARVIRPAAPLEVRIVD